MRPVDCEMGANVTDGTPRPRRALTPPSAETPDTASPTTPSEPQHGSRFAAQDDAPTTLLPATLAAAEPSAQDDLPATEPGSQAPDAPVSPATPPTSVWNTSALLETPVPPPAAPQATAPRQPAAPPVRPATAFSLGSGRRFSAASAFTPERPPSRGGRGRLPATKWLILAGIAVLAVIALVVTLVLVNRPGTEAPTTGPAPTDSSEPPKVPLIEQSLLTRADLQRLQAGQWRESQTETEITASSPQPQCLGVVDATPKPAETRLRVYEMTDDAGPQVLQLAQTYPNDAAAKTAMNSFRQELGACDAAATYVRSGFAITKLADESVGLSVAVGGQSSRAEHLVVLTRTGTTVSIFDFATQSPQQLAPALGAISPALARLCAEGGQCPTGAGTAVAPPPPADPQGWMQPSDLPLISTGVGTWARADNPPGTINSSQCENMNLASVAGPSSRAAKTYIVDQDPQRPATFGVDQAVFVFPDAGRASAFAGQLRTNIAQCGSRSTTATVTRPVPVNGPGESGAVSGAVFRVTQRTSANTTVVYRVAVVNSGRTVTYVLANPSENYDFTDAEWLAVALRAGQRGSQHP